MIGHQNKDLKTPDPSFLPKSNGLSDQIGNFWVAELIGLLGFAADGDEKFRIFNPIRSSMP